MSYSAPSPSVVLAHFNDPDLGPVHEYQLHGCFFKKEVKDVFETLKFDQRASQRPETWILNLVSAEDFHFKPRMLFNSCLSFAETVREGGGTFVVKLNDVQREMLCTDHFGELPYKLVSEPARSPSVAYYTRLGSLSVPDQLIELREIEHCSCEEIATSLQEFGHEQFAPRTATCGVRFQVRLPEALCYGEYSDSFIEALSSALESVEFRAKLPLTGPTPQDDCEEGLDPEKTGLLVLFESGYLHSVVGELSVRSDGVEVVLVDGLQLLDPGQQDPRGLGSTGILFAMVL